MPRKFKIMTVREVCKKTEIAEGLRNEFTEEEKKMLDESFRKFTERRIKVQKKLISE